MASEKKSIAPRTTLSSVQTVVGFNTNMQFDVLLGLIESVLGYKVWRVP